MTNQCPNCNQSNSVHTNICTSRNPIFNCIYGLNNISHTHHYCQSRGCVSEWIVISVVYPKLNGTINSIDNLDIRDKIIK